MQIKWSEYFLAMLMIIAAVALCMRSELLTHDQSSSGDYLRTTDFIIFDTAAHVMKDAAPAKLYDMATQHKVQTSRMNTTMEDTLPFIYPPYVALPLLLMPESTPLKEYRVWEAVLTGLSLLLVVSLLRLTAVKEKGTLLIGTFLMLTYVPWLNSIAEGQAMVFVVLCIVASWLLMRKQSYILAGVLLVLAAIKPQAVAAPALFIVILGGPRVFIAAALTSISLIAACTFIFGIGIWHSYLDMIHLVYATNGRYGIDMARMVDLRALEFFFFGDAGLPVINALSMTLSLGTLALSAYAAWRVRFAKAISQELAFALIIVLAALTSPIMHQSSLLLLAIPMAVLLKEAGRSALRGVMLCLLVYAAADMLLPALRPVTSVTFQLILATWITMRLKAQANVIA